MDAKSEEKMKSIKEIDEEIVNKIKNKIKNYYLGLAEKPDWLPEEENEEDDCE